MLVEHPYKFSAFYSKYNIWVMSDHSQKNKRNSYKKITQEVREAIIDRILNNGENIKEVSAAMNVNISTCKAILKVYQEEGRIGKKKKRNKVVNVIETFSFYCVNEGSFEQIDAVKIEESKLSLKRNENLDKTLEDNARTKAEKLLEEIVENKRKEEEEAAEFQRQMAGLQTMQNNYSQYFTAINPYMINTMLPQMTMPLNPYIQNLQPSDPNTKS